MLSNDSAILAFNPDGGGEKKLAACVTCSFSLDDLLQPGGNLITRVSYDGMDFSHLSLSLLSLPDLANEKITDLTSPKTEPPGGMIVELPPGYNLDPIISLDLFKNRRV